MYSAVRTTAFLVLALATVGGCRLIGSSGPVSAELAACRQFAQRGQAALEQGDRTAAEALFAQAIDTNPEDASARRYYADVLWRRGAYEEALSQAEEARRLAADDPGIAVQLGEMHLAMGRVDDAYQLANAALDANPQTAGAWALRGRATARKGDLDRALADLLRALEYLPGERQLLFEAAELYRAMGRPGRALATLGALRETYAEGDEPARVPYLEGLALAALGRHADAVDAYRLAMERQTPTANLLARLAEAQFQLGQMEQAAHSVEQALALDSNHAVATAVWRQIEGQRLASLPKN
jgi:tetratricopeptide (TPR) repeat protein